MLPLVLFFYFLRLTFYFPLSVYANNGDDNGSDDDDDDDEINEGLIYPEYKPSTKLGTWGLQFMAMICVVKPEFRRRNDVFERLDEAFMTGDLARLILLPPREKAIYKVQSDNLGVLLYTATVPLNYEYFHTLHYLDIIDETAKILGLNVVNNHVLEIVKEMKMFFEGTDDVSDKSKKYPFSFCSASEPVFPNDIDGESQKYWSHPSLPKRDLSFWKIPEEEEIPETDIAVTRNAMAELPYLSWPFSRDIRSKLSRQMKESYYHYKEPGKGVVVYLLDTGVDPSHPDLQSAKFSDWISSGPFHMEPWTDNVDNNFSNQPHGTLMAGKIVGKLAGVAQSAEIVAISCSQSYGLNSEISGFDCLLKAYDHIKRYNSGKPCIINFSRGILDTDVRGSHENHRNQRALELDRVFEYIQYKFENLKNVIFVAAAGNEDPDDGPISDPPASLGSREDLKRLLVVGGSNAALHNVYRFNSTYVNMVWAPAQWILSLKFLDPRVPENLIEENMYYVVDDGQTSSATAIVSGLLATYISRNRNSETRMDDAIAEMKRLAHARIPETREGQPIDPKVVPVVWNGVPIRLWPKDDQEKIRKLVPGAQDLGLEVRPYIHTKSIPRESRKPVPTRTSNNLPADWTSITSLYIQTKSIPRKSQKPEPPPTSTMTDTRTSVTWSNRLPLFRTATAEINQKDGPL